MKTSFDKHLDSVLSQGHEKVASRSAGDNFINKLAEEILGESLNHVSEVPLSEMPVAEGMGEAVMSATDSVIMPAIAAAGADIAAVLEGDEPAEYVDYGDTTMKGTGIPTDVTAKEGTDPVEAMMEDMSEEQIKEASVVGAIIADSILDRLEKVAHYREYSAAVGILKEAGLLDRYNIQDPGMDLEKTASSNVSGLEKIAAGQALSHDDIISAAVEYLDIEKTASEVEEIAREDAADFVKTAADVELQARSDAREMAKLAEYQEEVAADQAQLVKEASANPQIRQAITVLAQYGLV